MRVAPLSVRMYHILADSFHVSQWIEAHGRSNGQSISFLRHLTEHVDLIKDAGWTHLYLTGGFVRGKLYAKGRGTPFCIRNHLEFEPSFGTADELRSLATLMPVVLDFVPNHTAWDHPWMSNRDFYRSCSGSCQNEHCCRNGIHCAGFWDDRCGQRRHWSDIAQLNLTEPLVWEAHTHTARELLRLGIAGFRIDTADNFKDEQAIERLWGVRPRENYFQKMVARIRDEYPNTLLIAESNAGADGLEACGIDVVYDGSERTGELAWRDELAGRDARAIQRKITRLAQLFNEGRARQIDCGNHDQPAPRRRYGSWLPGAEALTFFAPGPLLFLGGNESEYDGWVDNDARMAAEEMETRPQPLSRECQVDWCSGGVTSLYARLFSERRAINGRLGSSVCWVPSKTDGSEGWVGYRVQGNSFSYTVLANPSQEPVAVREHGNVELEPGGFRVLVQDSNMLEQVFKRVVRAGERVKNLRVEADLHSNVLHLHGETRSYYARQCAQHAVMSLRENFSVKDHITSW